MIKSKNLVVSALFLFQLFLSCTHKNDSVKETQTVSSKKINQIPINWIANWNNRESKKNLLINAAREFELLNQDLNITIKFQEEFCGNCPDARTTIQDTIINMIRSGNYNWDIVVLTQKYYKEISRLIDDPEWGKKYLVNFEEFDWFKESHIPVIFEIPQYRNDFGGIIAGPLVEGRFFSLWYNKKTADKLGLQIKPTGMTFADFKGYLQKTYEYNQNHPDKVTIFFDDASPTPSAELVGPLVLSELGDFENKNLSVETKRAALLKTFKALEELAQFKPFENLANVTFNKDKDPILDGNVLFSFWPSSIINQWEADNKMNAQDMQPAEFPVFEKPGIYYHGSYQSVWAIFKDAPHRDEAIKFFQYMCSNDFAERWLSETKNPTAIKVKIDASDVNQDNIEKFNRYIEKTYENHVVNYDISKLLFGVNDVTIDGLNILKGTISAEEYYQQILRKIQNAKK